MSKIHVWALALMGAAALPAQITTFDPPGSAQTAAQSINTVGAITGFYADANGVDHGFVRDSAGNFTTFDPTGSTKTLATSINDAGAITGYYIDANGVDHGFVRDSAGNFTTFDPTGNTQTIAQSINTAGAIAGYYIDANGVYHGFVRDSAGNFTPFDPPGSTFTSAQSMNTAGAITGYYADANGVDHGFVRDSGGNFTMFDPTGSTQTIAQSINQAGAVTGYYTDANHVVHGFLFVVKPTDTTPPVIVPQVAGTAGPGGWYPGSVSLSWSLSDPESGIASSADCGPVTLTATATVTCTATNGVGLSSSVTKAIRIDTTPPVIVPAITGAVGTGGWYTSAVTVTWGVADPESGVVSPACAPSTLTASGTATCSATNGAGLTASVSQAVKIDMAAPTISGMPVSATCSLWPPNGKLVTVATVSVPTDAGSPLAFFNVTGTSNEPSNPRSPSIVITGSGLQPRTVRLAADRLGTGNGRIYTITATASDQAGNAATTVSTCTVPHDQGK